MTEKKLLIGSLSNDLLRVANLVQRGSYQAAYRFLREAQKWSTQLNGHDVKGYIQKISNDVSDDAGREISIETAEKYLMYSVLLQNYALHID